MITTTLAVDATGLTKSFGDHTAVDHLDISVAEGEIFGLLGPNGAGKTTTISILCSLIRPDEGKVHILGHDLVRRANRAKALVGLVPQELSVYPPLTATQNLSFFGGIHGLSGSHLKDRIAVCLEMAGLSDRANDTVDEFSGGMKRRLNIAAGVIHEPRLLFLDEPTVGVDPQSRNFIFEHVEMLRDQGMTVVYTTHYMEEAERLCSRIGIMDEGKMIALGSNKELIGSLGGGLLKLEVAEEHMNPVNAELESLASVRSTGEIEGQLQIQADDGTKTLLDVARVLDRMNIPVRALEVLEPNLENVFLQLTGKGLRDGGQQA